VDNQALELRVNNARALRIVPTTDTPNLIGGYGGNDVGAGLVGGTIGGGGTVQGVQPNLIVNNGQYGTIAGGYHNTVSNYGGAILGGSVHLAGGYFAAIGAGQAPHQPGELFLGWRRPIQHDPGRGCLHDDRRRRIPHRPGGGRVRDDWRRV